MTSNTIDPLNALAMSATPRPQAASDPASSWFEAIARSWGQTLDGQAQRITDMSNQIGDGQEKPSQIAMLTAESMRMSFMSQSESTSMDSIGRSLETMARKQ